MTESIDIDKAAKWINEQWKGSKRCPICESNDWIISDKAFELREYSGGNIVAGGALYPLVCLTCKVCGYSMFFNAIISNLVTKTNPPIHVKKEGE